MNQGPIYKFTLVSEDLPSRIVPNFKESHDPRRCHKMLKRVKEIIREKMPNVFPRNQEQVSETAKVMI